MATSIPTEINTLICKKVRKLTAILFFSLLTFGAVLAQPVWVPTTPSIGTVGALNIPINYGTDRVGTVYIVILNYNNPIVYAPGIIKTEALNAPYPQKVFQAAIPVTAGNINTIQQVIANVLAANTTYTVYIVAEATVGGLQAVTTRFTVTTAPCTKIDVLTGFTQPVTCVNKGAVAVFQVVILNPDPNANGILKGTQWTLDWGDGTTAAYTSTADNDLPPLALRTHTYVTITDCNYVFSNGVRNPCGETRAVQYVAVVHGRDIPSDGDGLLQIVDNASGSTTINVCAGTQTTITLRDNSTWNCQNPVLPGGLTAVPNTDPRNIEWLYGRDPIGAITNTITGAVAIAAMGNAPQASGRLSPIAAPGTLSQAITIPATCLAGQYFRVYLKNWNKCNWTDPEYVNTFVDINVIAAPPAPTAASRTICTGDVRTLTVTSPPVGTITWYSDALLTVVAGSGVNFTPAQTLPGTYDFWVTDQSTTGLLCMSPATKVTLVIRETLAQPGVITGPAQVCSNQAGVIFSVAANPPVMPVGGATQYVWTVPAGWTITAGQGTKQITVTANAVAGIQTISLIDQYIGAPNCPSASRSTTTNLNPVATINSANAKTVCDNTALAYTATSATVGCSFAWTRAVVAGISNPIGSGATALINESLDNTSTAPVNVIYVITPTINGCAGTPFNLTVTVNPTATVSSANTKTVCDNAALGYTITSLTAGATFSWTRAVVAGIANGIGAGATSSINENLDNTTTGPVNVIYVITPGYGGCPGTVFNLTVTVNPTAVITSSSTANVCDNVPVGYTATSSTAGATFAWTRAVVAGIANPIGSGATSFINESLDNTTVAPITVTYMITPSYGGCAGTAFPFWVTVNPTSVITSLNTKTVCDNVPLAYTATSSTPLALFSWTRAVVPGISNGVGSGAGALINESLDNTTSAPVNVIYTITPAINLCSGTPFTLTVTVNPTAVITSAAAKTVCDITALGYTATSSTAGATFAWTRAVVAGISNGIGAGATSSINELLDNTTAAPVNATYIITPSYGGCPGTPFNLVVTVNPTAVITSSATTSACDNAPIGFTATSSTAGATFAWTRAVVGGIVNGAGAGATALINESLDNNTNAPVAVTYVITPSYGGCPGTPSNLVVTVNPTAVITSAAAKTVCSNTPIAYTATSSTAGATFSWSRAVVAGISNGVGSGAVALINESLINTTAANVNAIYIITPSIGGCPGTPFNFTVTVHPQFTVAQLHDPVSICNNSATNINVVMTGGTSPYTVNYTKNGIAQAAWNNYVSGTNMTTGLLLANTTYVLTSVTDNYGCPAQGLGSSILITVGAPPTAATLTGSGDACFGTTSTLSSVITGGAPTYTIAYTRNGVAQPNITLYNSGTNYSLGVLPVGTYNYQITSVTDLCGNTVPGVGIPGVYTIHINPVPDITGTIPAAQSFCNDGTASITLNSTVNNTIFNYTVSSAPAVGYTWVIGKTPINGSITDADGNGTETYSKQLNHNYNSPVVVTYTITPTGPGATACIGTPITRTVTVNPVAAIANKVASTCSAISFTVTPVNGADVVPAGTTYSWAIPVVTGGLTGGAAGAAAANISGTLTNPTNIAQTATYTVTPLSGGCTGATFTVIVTVNPTPAIANKVTAACSAAAFAVTPVNGADIVPAGTTYTWAIPVVTGGITGGAAGAAAANINGTLTNPTNTPQTATYTVTPLSGGCTGTNFTVIVTVNPKPAIANKIATTCSGTAFSSTPVNGADIVPAGTTYSWAAPAVTGGMTGGAGGAAAASISGTLNNPTNIAQTATYTVTPLSGGCTGTNFTVTVTVNPTPAIANKLASACSATAFTVTPVNGADIVPAGTTYSWAIPVVTGGLTGGAAGAAAANISGTLTNPTNTPQTATYTVTPLSGGCSGATFTITLTVNPKPAIANKIATTCGGTAFTVTPVNGIDIVPAGTTYSWAAPAITGGLTGGAAGAGIANVTGTLNNPTNVAQTATYTVTPLSGGCTGATFTVTVTVNPTPVIANKIAITCSGAAFSGTPVNGVDIVPAGTTYSWPVPVVTGGLTGGVAGAASASITGTLTNPTNTAQTATYTVTPLSGGCTGANFTVTVTVNPAPAISNKLATTCSATAFTVSPVNGADIVPAGTTYTWPVPAVTGGLTGGAGGAAAASITGTLNNPTNTFQTATYTVTPSSGGCTGVAFTVTVTVNPKPSIAAKVTTTCSGTAFTVTPVNGIEIVPAGTTYSWPVPAVTGGMTGGAAGAASANISGTLTNPTNVVQTATYTVTPLAGGCTGANFTVTVTINPSPNIANKLATTCSGTAFTVTPVNGGDIVPVGTSYSWAIPAVTGGITGGAAGAAAANITGTLNNPTNTPQTATYTVTPLSGGCTGATFTITVTVSPKPAIANKLATTCSGTAFTVTPVNGADIVPAGTTYSWAIPVVTGGITGGLSGAGAASISGTLNNPTNTPQTATYTVTPLSGGCTGLNFTVTVTVNPTPAIANKLATACSAAAFTVSPVNGADIVPAGTTYTWAVPVVTGGLTGGAAGAAAANISGTLTNPTNTPQTATYTATPLSGGCTGATFTVIVTVNPKPAIANKIATTCGGTAFTVTPVNGVDIVPAGTTYSWAIPVVTGGLTGGAAGAGAANISGTLNNPTNIAQTATYTVTPLSGGCTGTNFTVTITVSPTPAIANKVASTCSAISFTVTPVNGADVVPAGTTYSWAIPVVTGGLTGGAAGAAAANISGTLTNPTNIAQTATYTVTPLSGGCTGATFTVIVTVNPTPAIANKVTAACSAAAFAVTPVNGADIVPAGTTYTWAIPVVTGGITGGAAGAAAANINGTLTNPTNTPQTATYTVTPLSGGCTGTNFTVIVTVNPKPAIANKIATTCSGTAFSSTPVNGADIVPAGTTYSWAAPAVTGGMTGGAGGAAAASISGTLNNPTNIAQTATYTVTPLSGGCTGTNFTVTVTVNPTPAIANKLASACSATAFTVTPVNGADIVPAGTTYSWAIPVVTGGLTGGAAGAAAANISGTLTNPTNTPQTATYTVTPLSGGCSGATFTITVTINPVPAVNNMISTSCSATGFTIIPVNGVNGIIPAGTTYSWPAPAVTGGMTGGVAGLGAVNISGSITNATNSLQTATYTVTPTAGACAGLSFTITVTINPTGQANQPADQIICNGANITAIGFTTTNIGGVTTYAWTNSVPGIGLAASGTGNIGVFSAVNAGTTPVVATIIVTPTFTNGAVGCAGPAKSFTITVNPTPLLSTTLTPADICSNNVFSYPPASATAGTTFNWSRATIAGITPAGPTAGINNPNETLRNITSLPIAVTYQYTLLANGCSNVQNVVVKVNPEPVITPAQNPVSCSGNALNYNVLMNNFTNPADNVTFTWGVPVLNPVNPLFTGGSARAIPSAGNITDVYINTTGALGTATYIITPFKNGCAGTPVTLVVTVGSEPVLDPGLNAFACSNSPIGLILKEAIGSVIPTYYNIISKTVAPGLTDVGNAMIPNGTAPANYLSNDRYTNTSGVNKTVTYRVQPILAPSCIGAPLDVVITIRPQPVIFPAQSKTVCSQVTIGKEILLAPPNVPAGSVFNWSLPAMSDGSIQGTAGVNVAADPAGTLQINDQIHNYSAAPIQATYTVTAVSQFGCAGTPMPVIITINPEPVPQPISGRDKICVTDKNIVYNVNAVGGSTFHWTVDAAVGTKTFDFNTNAILIDAAAVAGLGNITVYETNSYTCSGAVSTLPVQVYTQPAPENIIGNPVVCANSTEVYNVTNRAGSIYSWTVPGGAAIMGDPSASSITVIFSNVGGTISVRETNAAGCTTNHTPKAITVNPLPTATISGGATICDGASRNLSVNFTGVGPYTFTYALNGVPQAPVATASNPYTLNVTQAGTYTIVNVTDANCTNNGTGTTTVSFFPKPTGVISGTSEMCLGTSATLTMAFTGVAPYTFTYTDGTTPVTVVGHLTNVYTVPVSPIVNTTYTLTSLTDGNSCTGVVSGSAVISINIPPTLTLTGTNLICNGVNTGSVNMAIAGGTSPFGYSWTGPSGFTANTQNISLLEAGYYAAVVLDSKGCTGTGNITLTQPPVLNGSAAGTNITCFGANDGTILISGITGGTGTYMFTTNGGGTWQASPSFTGLTPGTYNVMMRDAVNPTCTLVLNGSLLLTQPAILNATITKTDINCFGANNGSIVISAPAGGYGTYGYSINGGATWQGSGNFINLTPGSYNVRIRDAANTGCFVILNPALVVAEPVVLSAVLASTDVTCYSSADGTITVSAPAGGHGTFEYSINGGGSWQASGSYSALSPGTYNVQIRDAAFTGCFKVLNAALVITQPAVLQANVSSTNITCNGANDGIINITAPLGGYGTYQYSIDGGTVWQNTGLFNGLAPGIFDVRIRDAAHVLCFEILNAGLQITQPAALNATVIDTDISCFGANDGVIQITNSAGGYGTYEYSDNGGTTWQAAGLFTALIPGTYNVQIRDKAHTACVKILDPAVVISQPAVLNAIVNHTNVTCFGANDGTIIISAPTGGYGSYGYSINGGTSWQGSASFTNLAPGTYNIRIRDAVNTGCIISLNPAVVITEPVVLSASIVKTNINCNGAADGSITINGAAGGSGTYEYTVNGGGLWQASNIFAGLIPGFYNVKIRDAVNTGCIVTLNGSLNVTEPPVLNANVAKTNITCNGASNGTITISSPTGGYGTYEYSIDGGALWQVSGSFTALPPASYNVQIRDAAHTACVITLNAALAITQPAVLAATVTPSMISCFGANNGIISITGATGGYGTYEYSINGGTSWSGLGNFTNLAPNTYDVRIRDAANTACTITLNGALLITQPAVLSAVITKTDVTCFGASNGSITISGPVGGYGTYEYSINGGGSWQASGNFSALSPGNYNVQIRDAAHPTCAVVLNNAVQITQPAILNAVITQTNITCNGANNGIINITAPTGGFGTYEYSINGGALWQASGLFNALSPATYDVRIRDAANIACVIVLNNSLTISEPAVISANITSTNITCSGANNGTIIVSSPSGGYGTYEFSNDGGTTWQATGNFINLSPASYNIQIRDKAHTGCVIVLNPALVITQPNVLSATVTSSNVTCFGSNNGTITITNPLGGYGTYEYSMNGGANWQSSGNFTNIAPGVYNIRIRDAANTACFIILDPARVITQPVILAAAVTKTDVTCSGAGNGTITISAPTGGYGTYEYTVNGGIGWQASGNFAALNPGFYNVQIRDAANTSCVVILNASLQITQPALLSANVTKTNVTCTGANDGTIIISSPTGGYGTYEYSVNGGAFWQASGSFTALPPASYNVQIRDAANTGCVIILNPALVITQPVIMTATVTPTMVTCNSANDGVITITGAAGGYGTYQYSVNGGTTWQGSGIFTTLAPANYDVRMRDAANTACVIILNPAVAITQPVVLVATVTKTDVTCFGGSNGSIIISAPSGGYGTYEYTINGGGSWQASGNFNLLVPGNYNVQIRDAAHTSCVKVLNAAVPITQPAIITATVTPTNVSCNGANNGIINITAPTGGSGTYGYSIDGGTTWLASGLFNGLVPGIYNVQIRDAANISCVNILNASLTITEPFVLNANLASTNVTCNGANDGSISITSPTGGYGTFEYTDNGGGTWQASGNFINLAAGPYNVQIRDKAHPACVIVLDGALVITEPAVLSGALASSNITCFGANNGTISITNPLGGYGTYSYSINGGTTWQPGGIFTNLAPSTYSVKMRDAAHTSCEVTLNALLTLTQPQVLSASVSGTNVTCSGAGDGTITIINPLGGSGTFEYSVNGGILWQASGNFTGLIPGFYNVQIRDAANPSCVIILNGSLQITQPLVLSAFVSKANVTCNGGTDGSITILGATGGYGTYQYSINGGGSWQASGTFSGLIPATYNVQMRDAAHISCVIVLDGAVIISQPAALSATVTPTMATCFGASDGKITISGAAGGYGTYQYSINGGTTWQGSGTFTNLAPASYNVQIRDAGNMSCVIILNPAIVITQPVVLSATLAHTNVSCYGGNDGSITISAPSGGYGTYEYSINGGGSWQASGNFTMLTPGSYSVLIRDAAHTGCIAVLSNSYVIGQPAILAATVSKTDISCNGANDGTITISLPSGGSGTYDYSIDGGTSWVGSGNFVNLVPATYDIRIRDAVNPLCSAILYPNLVITEPILLALTSTGNILLDCNGDTDGTGTFFGSGGTMPYTFHVITNTTGATLAGPGFNSQTFFNAGAGTIVLAVTDFKGCFAQATINITQPLPMTPGTIAANQILCSGDNPAPITETVPAAGGPGAYNYQWQYGSTAAGPFVNIAGATAVGYTPAAGTVSTLYYRRMNTSGFCMPVYSNVVEILVNPKPVAILSGGETICPSQASILKVNMMIGTGPFELDIDNLGTITGYVSGADISVSPLITTVYKLLRVKDANGCQIISPSPNLLGSATVIVRNLPAITTSPVNKTSCEYGLVSFSTVATGTDLTYQWFVNTGSGFNPVADGGIYFGATNPTLNLYGVTRLMNGYVYHAEVSGCSSTVTTADATLSVNTAPEISAQPKDSTACMNAGAAFKVTAAGSGITYQWQVNKGAGFINVVDDANFSGSTLNTLSITNAQAAFNNYIFRVILTGTCGIPTYSNFAVLRVNIPPVITMNPVNKATCDGTGPVIFVANGSGIIDSLRWQVFTGGVWSDVHDNSVYSGSTSQQLTLLTVPAAFNANQYRLALKAKCIIVNTTAAILTVHANPVVDFTAIDPIHACGSVPLVINGNPTAGSGTWTSHLWTGDTGPLNNYFTQSPTFNSQIAGTYVLNYKVKDSNGCFGNGNVTVLVDAPDATFAQDRSGGCTPALINFTKDMTGVAKFWWDFGDGSPKDSVNANPTHTFTNISPASIGYSSVKLTVRSPGGCLDTYTSTVIIYPAINASFTALPATVCSGSQVVFNTMPGASKYFWDFGDGVSGYYTNSTNHIYTNLGLVPVVHTVILTTTSFYNCTDVQTSTITVMPLPLPQFSAAPPTQEYDPAGNAVVFTNMTNAGAWNMSWKFGDGITSGDLNPSHTYTALGTFNVILKVSNSICEDSIIHQVIVTPKRPVAKFDYVPSACSPLEVKIKNTSLYTETPGTTYLWDFGDGGSSTTKNPDYTYFTPGTYRINLTVTGPGGKSEVSQVISSYPAPMANFQISPTVVFVDDEQVRCFNLTNGADSYVWDFGDGGKSTEKEPYHKYTEEGTYDVTLWAYLHNIIGLDTVVCSDKYVVSPGVTVQPSGVLRFSTVFTPNQEGEIDMDHLPTSGVQMDEFFYPPIRDKVIEYKLQVFNRLGVLIFESHDINRPWNGYYHNKLCAQGVYVWYVEGKYANGKPFKKVGDVTLLNR